MRKVILQEFISLDGLAAGPNGSVDFVVDSTQGDQTFGQAQLDFIDTIDTILLGSVTYRLFADYWPTVTTGEDKPLADRLNATPKIVFSKTLNRAPWGTWDEAKVVKRSVAEEITMLKQQPGKDMVIWGSISLAQSVMRAGLIDEYQLVICPLVLGNGRRLFTDDMTTLDMEFLEARSHDLGSVLLRYWPRDKRHSQK